jgi:hypothetical protein
MVAAFRRSLVPLTDIFIERKIESKTEEPNPSVARKGDFPNGEKRRSENHLR